MYLARKTMPMIFNIMGFSRNILFRFVLIILLNISSVCAFNYDAFTQYVEKSLKEWGVAGAAITIVEKGKVKYLKCFGVEVQGKSAPVTESTQFLLASLTKAFTSVLLVKLSEENLIDLEKPVQFYLPSFKLHNKNTAARMTVRDLVSHNSGMPEFMLDSFGEMGLSEDEMYLIMDQIASETELDTKKHAYQNIFPGIAGMIIQKITGKPLSTVYKHEIFDPLGFQDTTIGKNGLTGGESLWQRLKSTVKSWMTPRVGEHYLVDGQSQVIPGGNPGVYKFPSTRGINASIRDMAKWLQFWETNKDAQGKSFLPETMKNIFFEVRSSVGAPSEHSTLFPADRVKSIDYGMGWYLYDYASFPKIYSHMGGMTGNRSLILLIPEREIGMVILCNVGGMRVNLLPEALRSKFLDMLLDLEPDRDWSQELLTNMRDYQKKAQEKRVQQRLDNPVPAHDIDTYVGEFTNKLYGKVQITKEKLGDQERLVLHYRDSKAFLTHWNGDNFTFNPVEFSGSYSATDYGSVVFGYDASGKAAVLMVSFLREGDDNTFYRVSKEKTSS